MCWSNGCLCRTMAIWLGDIICFPMFCAATVELVFVEEVFDLNSSTPQPGSSRRISSQQHGRLTENSLQRYSFACLLTRALCLVACIALSISYAHSCSGVVVQGKFRVFNFCSMLVHSTLSLVSQIISDHAPTLGFILS